MAGTFEQIEHEPRGVRSGPWVRRAVLLVLALVVTLALANRFGQRPAETTGAGPAASMTLSAPGAVRGGLFFQSRLDIRAARDIEHPRIVLEPGWVEGMQCRSTRSSRRP